MQDIFSLLQQSGQARACGEAAEGFFTNKKNKLLCAEATLTAIAQCAQIDSPLFPGIATGFCGGMARTSNVCGALAGAIMGISIVHGRQSSADKTDAAYIRVQLLCKGIEKEFASTNCKNLTGYDLAIPEEMKCFSKDKKKRQQCAQLVTRCAEIACYLNDCSDEQLKEFSQLV